MLEPLPDIFFSRRAGDKKKRFCFAAAKASKKPLTAQQSGAYKARYHPDLTENNPSSDAGNEANRSAVFCGQLRGEIAAFLHRLAPSADSLQKKGTALCPFSVFITT